MDASRRSRAAALIALALALAAWPPAALGAQAAAPVRSVDGRVVLPSGAGVIGVAGAWVVLHRVGRDVAGPLDSMRTRVGGGYGFRYRPEGDTTAVYFVSTTRAGVAYFTPPMREPVVRGSTAELLVYDTTSAPIPITVRGRHVIVTSPDSGSGATRTVIEVYELSNDSSLTRVARDSAGATFEAPLPPGVRAVTGGQGDVSADAIVASDGRVRVTAPIAPGPKQFSFFYELPANADPIALRVESAVPAVEVLIEDPRGRANGAGLIEVTPVEVEGRPFKRFLAQDVGAGAEFIVIAPGPSAATGGLRLMLVVTAVGAAMLLGLGMAFMRRGPSAFARRRNVDPESLALEVAALDAAFEKLALPTEQQRAEHYISRAQLKGRLSAALAKRDELG